MSAELCSNALSRISEEKKKLEQRLSGTNSISMVTDIIFESLSVLVEIYENITPLNYCKKAKEPGFIHIEYSKMIWAEDTISRIIIVIEFRIYPGVQKSRIEGQMGFYFPCLGDKLQYVSEISDSFVSQKKIGVFPSEIDTIFYWFTYHNVLQSRYSPYVYIMDLTYSFCDIIQLFMMECNDILSNNQKCVYINSLNATTIPIITLVKVDSIESNIHQRTFQRGLDYYGKHRAHSIKSEGNLVTGTVIGSSGQNYYVEYRVEKHKIVQCCCECPAFQRFPGPCKHIVCTVLEHNSNIINAVKK